VQCGERLAVDGRGGRGVLIGGERVELGAALAADVVVQVADPARTVVLELLKIAQ
jgi:hypothetical protein